MKRFYRAVSVAEQDGGFAITLDGKTVRTPGKVALVVPASALAESIAGEWRAQVDEIAPATMRLNRLANSAIDTVARRREDIIAEIIRYAGTDLLCYRAEAPAALVERQAGTWQPLIEWLALRHNASLAVFTGLLPVDQPDEAIDAIRGVVSEFPDFPLTALHAVAAACSSVVIGLAVADGRLNADAAWHASLLDESFQIEQWGEDADASDRREALRADIAAATTFMALCGET